MKDPFMIASPTRPMDQAKANETQAAARPPLIEVRNLELYYGPTKALKSVEIAIGEKRVTAFIGPSGCGKSTLLRCFNRMNDLIDNVRITGSIRIGGQDIYARSVDVIELRKRVGMVFQRSNPFPKSIYENIAFGLRLQGIRRKSELDEITERSLAKAALWGEVKDRLHSSALGLSGGQQQRLCIARAIAVKPDVAPYHLNLGLAFQASRKPDEAIACYQRALQLQPEFVEVHYNLGNAWNEQGQLAEAAACYRRAIELRPNYAEAHYNLGKVLQDQGK